MEFGYVAPPYGEQWSAIVTLLDAAVTRNGIEWDEVARMLAENRAQLWLATQGIPVAAMVTSITDKTLEVWLAGGAVLSGCIPFLEVAIDASKKVGTTNGRIVGRKGWARVLQSYDWRSDGDDLVKEWSNG